MHTLHQELLLGAAEQVQHQLVSTPCSAEGCIAVGNDRQQIIMPFAMCNMLYKFEVVALNHLLVELCKQACGMVHAKQELLAYGNPHVIFMYVVY